MKKPVYLDEQAVTELAPSPTAIADSLAGAFRVRASGRVIMPAKSKMTTRDGATFFHAMPALIPETAAGVKWVGGAAGNSVRDLPHIHALLLISDHETGAPLAVIEAGCLTGVRTAALSLLAARHLARKEARRLAVIGCGLQARTHLDALRSEFPIKTVAVYGRRRESIDRFAAFAEERGLAVQVFDDAAEALGGADIVVSSIPEQPGLAPFLDPARLEPGAFAAMVDLGRSWLPEGFGALDAVFTDDREQSEALKGSNRTFAATRFAGDLGDLESGRLAGRNGGIQRFAFLFPGVALADIVVGCMLLEAAQAH